VVKPYPPKSTFSEDSISAPKGCCAPKFSHALDNDQVLLAHPPTGDGGPPYNFLNCLKIRCISLKIFGARGYSLTKLCHMTCRYVGVITPIQLLGAPFLQNLGGQKSFRIRFDFRQLSTLTANACYRGKFTLLISPPQSNLGRRADSTLGFAPNF